MKLLSSYPGPTFLFLATRDAAPANLRRLLARDMFLLLSYWLAILLAALTATHKLCSGDSISFAIDDDLPPALYLRNNY